MGLHQQRASGCRTPSEEDEERIKVFRSLFLRDKTFSISRGTSCLLPSLKCSISFALGKSLPTNSAMFARLQLARLQEEIYQALYSSESPPMSTNQRRAAICRIAEVLGQWAEAYESPESSEAVHAVDVQLDFRASRIVALRSSSDPRHMEQSVHDARASILLLSRAVERAANAAPSTQEGLPFGLTLWNASCQPQSGSGHTSLRIRSLVESFPVPAFFVLVKNIIWPVLEDRDRCDVELLQTVSRIFKDLDHRMQVKTYTQKLSDTFQSLLAIVQVLRPDPFEQHEQAENQPQQQPYAPLTQQVSKPTPMVAINPAHCSHTSTSMTWLPSTFSDAGAPSQPAVNTTTTNLSAFEFPNQLEYDGSFPLDLTEHKPLSFPGHYNNMEWFISPNASNNDYRHQPFFSQFPHINPMLPLDGEQQDVTDHPF